MFPYILMTGIVAFFAVFTKNRPESLLWIATFIMLVLFVGLRHHVGMDWNNYLYMAERARLDSLSKTLSYSEPAYASVLWISAKLGMGVYGVNLFGSWVFFLGLFRYAKITPSPWLALSTAMPILVIVVAMSANRQTVAIGVIFWMFSVWHKSSVVNRVLFIFAASMFHYSAAVFLILVIFDLKVRMLYKLVSGVFILVTLFVFLEYTGSAEYYNKSYGSGQTAITQSSGAIMHVMLNGLPALLILFVKKNIRARLYPTAVQINMALLAIILIPAALVFSAASGRMTLYLFPVSMYVFSTLPHLIKGRDSRHLIVLLITFFMVGLTWFWLAFSNSSRAHIPYDNALFIGQSELHL